MPVRTCLLVSLFFMPFAAHAQAMPGMEMPIPVQPSAASPVDVGKEGMAMPAARTLTEAVLQHSSSGTSAEPPSTPMHMLMRERGGWRWMLHSNDFLADTQQHATNDPTVPLSCLGLPCVAPVRRGGDKLFSTNWVMPMAQRDVGPGRLTLRTMLSLEPATITGREYPELFQQGETAYGKPIVDGQHPHDFVMELAALYDLKLAPETLLSVYLAPVGDPAIGPTAYPHRQSASEDPIAALGHHQEDSTHIAFNVMTLGLTYRYFRLEESGFHGAEPTEARWHFQPSPNGLAPDSYATRVTFVPAANVAAQYSLAHITAPEQLHPAEDQRRQTASVMYNRPLGVHHDCASMPGMDMATAATGNWSNTLLWGQTKSLSNKSVENSYLLESLLQFRSRNYAWTRVESANRTTELLPIDTAVPVLDETPLGHVQAYTLGYDRDYRLGAHVLAAPGAQFTVYRTPGTLVALYGRAPFGAVAFVRFRISH